MRQQVTAVNKYICIMNDQANFSFRGILQIQIIKSLLTAGTVTTAFLTVVLKYLEKKDEKILFNFFVEISKMIFFKEIDWSDWGFDPQFKQFVPIG